MNYQKIYDKLMTRSIGRVLDQYTEKHHVIPKCVGGTNDQSNLVNLTPEEHFLAHQLLCKIYPDNSSLSYAANMMCVDANGLRVNNKRFGWLRRHLQVHQKKRIFSEESRRKMSESQKKIAKRGKDNYFHKHRFYGESNGFYGKKHTEETLAILRVKCANFGEANGFYGKKHSAQSLEKMQIKTRGRNATFGIQVNFCGKDYEFVTMAKWKRFFANETGLSEILGAKLVSQPHKWEKYQIKDLKRL